jgi:hypothetical protein
MKIVAAKVLSGQSRSNSHQGIQDNDVRSGGDGLAVLGLAGNAGICVC